MATICKRGDRYQVQVRKQGFPPITKSFSCKKTAEIFAKDTEARIERGLFKDSSLAEKTKISDLLNDYVEMIVPQKKGRYNEVTVSSF